LPSAGNPLDSAILEANDIKSSNGGTRIVTIGIGDVLEEDNLAKISGPEIDTGEWDADVMTAGFQDLSNTLVQYASNLCGGVSTTTYSTELSFFSFYHFLISFFLIMIIYFF